jgi:hypothetical protein
VKKWSYIRYRERQIPTYISIFNERKVDYFNDIEKGKNQYTVHIGKKNGSVSGIKKNKNQYTVHIGKRIGPVSGIEKNKNQYTVHIGKKMVLYKV